MATAELPYLNSYKNVGALFDKIATAKAPDTFTTTYLANTLGLKSTTDRPLISLLKTLGFLDGNGKPTAAYLALKNPAAVGAAIAKGVRHGYAPLFAANEIANTLDAAALKGLISQVTGAEAGMVGKILGTLQALIKKGDFAAADFPDPEPEPDDADDEKEAKDKGGSQDKHKSPLRPEFHYNIQIHLPANATEATYLDIFNAMRKAFIT
jgi:hypothetical protein